MFGVKRGHNTVTPSVSVDSQRGSRAVSRNLRTSPNQAVPITARSSPSLHQTYHRSIKTCVYVYIVTGKGLLYNFTSAVSLLSSILFSASSCSFGVSSYGGGGGCGVSGASASGVDVAAAAAAAAARWASRLFARFRFSFIVTLTASSTLGCTHLPHAMIP